MTRVARLVAAAFLAAAAGLVLPAPAAHSAPCSGESGVTVVVDFNGLGGGVQQACVAGGGGDLASSLFPAAGFPLSYASRQPGFVCRVEGVPASDPCVNTAPADAFWGLWWSNGDASSWTYSSLGAASLNVPEGGMVAFSYDDVDGSAPPSASASHPDAPPTQQPSQPPPDSEDPDEQQAPVPGSSTAPGHSSSPGANPSGSPSASDDVERGKGGMDQERSPKPDQSDDVSPTVPGDSPSETGESDAGTVAEPEDSDGLPGWVAPGLIGVLFAGAGVVVLLRRRGSGT